MSTLKFRLNGYEIDCTPEEQPDGRFVARAVLKRLADGQPEEVRPEFEPFATAAEASTAAHTAALAWVAHREPAT